MPELTPESIFPASWEEHAAFRSTFLMHFTKEGDRAALEILGQLLYEMLLEVSTGNASAVGFDCPLPLRSDSSVTTTAKTVTIATAMKNV